jgi:hypothetical protein
MYRYQVTCPYFVKKFEQHTEIKERLLDLIEKQESTSSLDRTVSDNITRTDWYVDSNKIREYWRFLKPLLEPHLIDVFRNLEYTSIELGTHWFQQYNTTDTHGWHRHANCSWANVYYAELPKGSPTTHLKDPVTGDIYAVEAEEGDILTFPSFILHCSPPNESEFRKTVVAFNVQ